MYYYIFSTGYYEDYRVEGLYISKVANLNNEYNSRIKLQDERYQNNQQNSVNSFCNRLAFLRKPNESTGKLSVPISYYSSPEYIHFNNNEKPLSTNEILKQMILEFDMTNIEYEELWEG